VSFVSNIGCNQLAYSFFEVYLPTTEHWIIFYTWRHTESFSGVTPPCRSTKNVGVGGGTQVCA